MGQKVNPNGLRIGISRGWSSQWYAEKGAFAENLKQDNAIRKFLTDPKGDPEDPKHTVSNAIKAAGLSRIDIHRANALTVAIYVMKPGIVLGQDGANVALIKKGLEKIVNGKFTKKQRDPKNKKPGDVEIKLSIVEVKNPDLDATLVARSIADQIEQRASFRLVQKKAIQRVMRAGAKGIKTATGGRLNGAEIARTESYREGPLGLMTLSQDIDYASAEAHTIYGVIGVKVWIARPAGFREDVASEKRMDDRRGPRRPFVRGARPQGQGQGRPQGGRPAPVPTPDKKGE